ncbi:MAG: tRNA lysidine(34) synthetase TilS [Candidatus Omnitrophica bacterium]|nr:tRNA lysidine(34) synthetase TilS [Candidatus Omnitrophota bacterium]
MTDSILKKVEKTVLDHNLFKTGDSVILGLSGGPDSTAMLLILLALKKNFKLKLTAVHLNHCLRGFESESDQNYVRSLARRFRIPYYSKRTDIAELARINKTSLEETAREARYEFFLEIARQQKAQKIAVAHTADDQAETVLMRIIQGTGLRGLAGIRPARNFDLKKNKNIKVLRPLIELTRAEVMIFLREKKYRPRQDSSNLNLDILRNSIRKELLPLLAKRYNPGIKNSLCRLSAQLTPVYDLLHHQAKTELRKIVSAGSEKYCVLNIKQLLKLDQGLRPEIIRLALEKLKGDLKGITCQHLLDIENMLARSRGWACLNLPRGLTVTREHNYLTFYGPGSLPDKLKAENIADSIRGSFPMRLKIPGTTIIKPLGLMVKTALITDVKKDKIKEIINLKKMEVSPRPVGVPGSAKAGQVEKLRRKPAFLVEYFDYDKLARPLELRLKEPGDRIRPLGLKGLKKIKDIFINHKVPAALKPVIPLILSGKDIIWVCSVCVSGQFKLTAQTKKILKISCQKI